MPGESKRLPVKSHQSAIESLLAVIIVVGLFLTMFAYTSNWPPLVVVESRSMQHEDGESFIGTMDTGDLVLVKMPYTRTDVMTYYDGMQSNYTSYGDYGDVIVYLRGGSVQQTPIIHRAILYLEVNPDGVSFRSWELSFLTQGTDFDFSRITDTWTRITSNVVLHDFGFRSEELVVPISEIIDEAQMRGVSLHSGYITKGDFNRQTDQMLGISPNKEPVAFEWLVGLARGELPWLGIVKLYLTGGLPEYTPQNSIDALILMIILIIVIPMAIEIILWHRGRRSGNEIRDVNSEKEKSGEYDKRKG